ncbi:MAG: hypothetical protein HY399_03880 [Elusimicrobia bacterium]|nr:hypothetical protein [Elusimicrobiota bacterium]
MKKLVMALLDSLGFSLSPCACLSGRQGRGEGEGFGVFVLLTGLLLSACDKKVSSPPDNHPQSENATPPFYYDLGSTTVDVSGYPEKQRENYRVFMAVCGTCHTAARPLNAPYIDRDVWKRYVHKMHLKMKGHGIELDPGDEEKIEDFLAYDSQVRKIVKKEEFQTHQEKLKKLFEEAREKDRTGKSN